MTPPIRKRESVGLSLAGASRKVQNRDRCRSVGLLDSGQGLLIFADAGQMPNIVAI